MKSQPADRSADMELLLSEWNNLSYLQHIKQAEAERQKQRKAMSGACVDRIVIAI